jgi:hypothetical protein
MAPTATVSIGPCWSLILRRGRRGKYHELVSGILLGVESLADDSALIVPLDGAGAMSIANLRSAVNRATKAGRSRLEPSRTKRTLRLEETSDRPLDNQDPTPPAPQLMTEE